MIPVNLLIRENTHEDDNMYQTEIELTRLPNRHDILKFVTYKGNGVKLMVSYIEHDYSEDYNSQVNIYLMPLDVSPFTKSIEALLEFGFKLKE